MWTAKDGHLLQQKILYNSCQIINDYWDILLQGPMEALMLFSWVSVLFLPWYGVLSLLPNYSGETWTADNEMPTTMHLVVKQLTNALQQWLAIPFGPFSFDDANQWPNCAHFCGNICTLASGTIGSQPINYANRSSACQWVIWSWSLMHNCHC